MRRRFMMAMLAVGVVVGYGSGFAQMRRWHQWHEQHQREVMSQFARTCVDAARADGHGR